jgi:Tfp pilus assembly protein PilN
MSDHSSFLPEDYLAQKAERRTNVISLILFAVVMLGVFLAFMFTNQRWSQVRAEQASINSRYQQAAEQIQELTELEEQKDEMLQKAELASALVERVPRSILLAELVNRMPDRLSLLELHLSSKEITPRKPVKNDSEKSGGRLKPKRAATKSEAAEEKAKIEAPMYQVDLELIGVAPTDLEVSHYLVELNAYTLVQDVKLEYSEEKEIEGQTMREFKLRLRLDPTADVRDIEPLIIPRNLHNPMSDQLRLTPRGSSLDPTAMVEQEGE